MGEEDELSKVEFEWGKKRGIGGRKKDVKFYESFTYDADQYTLYDSVYLYKDDETEPYVGKIIKIWQNSDTSKKVKILWFFRPCEIQNFIGPNDTSDNELFLASGEGHGLANVNPLEALAGKCNVVCTSKDSRNLQPSDEDLQMADFVFYRTFDVGQCRISDMIPEKIAGVEVQYLFNKLGSEKAVGVSEVGFGKKQVCADTMAYYKPVAAHDQNEKKSSFAKMEENPIDMLTKDNVNFNPSSSEKSLVGERNTKCGMGVKEMTKSNGESLQKHEIKDNADSKDSFVEKDSFSGQESAIKIDGESRRLVKDGSRDSITKKETCDGQEFASRTGVELRGLVESGNKEEVALERDKSESKSNYNDGDDNKTKKQEEVDRFIEGLEIGGTIEKLSKGRKPEVSNEQCSKNNHIVQKSRSFHDRGDVRASVGVSNINVDSVRKSRSFHDRGDVRAVRVSNKNIDSMQKSTSFHDRDRVKTSTPIFKSSKDDLKHKRDKDLDEIEASSKKIKLDANPTQTTLCGKSPKESPTNTQNVDHKVDSHLTEVSRRLGVDRSKWFKELPWEERIRNAHEDGRLVLLQNLDPSLTSSQVEEIIWHGFKESCSAKIIQRTAFSSPHSGKAFVVLKSREAAEAVVRKLCQGPLLSNGRPLFGSIGNPCLPEKKQTCYGHLVIDQIRLVQREMKDAVSTSHPSQSNTLEFDMAMEWCLLQERADRVWKKLYQRQQEEMRRLQEKLKLKSR